MSNTESFIDEVTEEVRRDRLFNLMRKYGWVAVVAVIAIVGSAGYSEYSRAKATAAAQAEGDAILAAFEIDDEAERQAAFAALPATEVVALLSASEYQLAGDATGATAALDTLAADTEALPIYRDMAAFKSILIQADTLDTETLKSLLAPLAVAGAPLRLLAMEQIALADLKAGDEAAALAGLQSIIEDAGVTRGLHDRASSLIVALGGIPVDGSSATETQ